MKPKQPRLMEFGGTTPVPRAFRVSKTPKPAKGPLAGGTVRIEQPKVKRAKGGRP